MAAEDNTPKKESLFAKLFSNDAQADKQLQKIRDGIYSFAWSRDRRDEAKLDWVLSENGVDRNVHKRWLEEASSGSNRDRIDKLPCWLLLADKQISADFIRFIYSVNDLDVLVDLKANDTESNKTKLDKIANLLQNANFRRYTRSARVRIHFPDKYPFQDLPLFNQHALDNIATALDKFQLLSHLSVRVVPMQGPEVYELRLAAFPFYPMLMTNWSISILNSRTFNWDIVAGEQLHNLNLAWYLFQGTGSLTAIVHEQGDAEKPPDSTTQAPEAKGADDVPNKSVAGQKKNGSQKRKERKLKALSAATAPSDSETTSRVPSADLPLRSKPPSSDLTKGLQSISVSVHNRFQSLSESGAEPSHTKSSVTQLPVQSSGKLPDTMPPACDAPGTAHQSSSPSSTNELETRSIVNPAAEASKEAVEYEKTAEQCPCPASSIETAPEESANQQERQEASPSSSAPSSVTLGRDQIDDEIEIHNTAEEPPQAETAMKQAGAESEKPAQKKRRNRKKGKKTKVNEATGIQSNDDSSQQNPAETNPAETNPTETNPAEKEETGRAFLISGDNAQEITTVNEWEGFFLNGQRPFPLSEIVDLQPWASQSEQLIQYKRANGKSGVLTKGSDLDRLSRQLERKAALKTEKQAEKMRAKGRKQAKKWKEVLIRRKEASDGLRKRLEDTKRQAAGQQGSDLRKRFSEITGEGLDKAATASQINDTEASDSDESFATDYEAFPELLATRSQSGSLSRPEDLVKSTVSHHGQPSSSSHATVTRLPGSSQVFGMLYDLEPGEEDQQAEHRNRQMDEQRVVEEVEGSDDRASVVSQYGDERTPSISDDEIQSPSTQDFGSYMVL